MIEELRPKFPFVRLDKVQCSAPVESPLHSPEWRRRRYTRIRPGYNPDCCQRESSIRIDGEPYCRIHAGGLALDKWIKGKLVEK